MISTSQRSRRTSGLTLLEVLAAVMIFAMVMSVLVGTSSNAVHHVGLSARRLEADLVANNLVADLEIQINQDNAPPIEDDDYTDEPYSIRITTTGLGPTQSGPASAPGFTPVSVAAGGTDEALSLLQTALPAIVGHLRQYDVEVSWFERSGVQRVQRTTFAFDWQAAQTDLAPLIQAVLKTERGESGQEEDETSTNEESKGIDGTGRRGASRSPFDRKPVPAPLSSNARENQILRGLRNNTR